MANLGTVVNPTTDKNERRSTRIPETVRLSVSGESKLGNMFSESTLTLAVNCHGCIYPSRNEHRTGSWVTLEFPSQTSVPQNRPVRAQVKFVRAPRYQNDHYEIGVELETPANVWRIVSTPEDWLPVPELITDTVDSSLEATHSTASHGPRVLEPDMPARVTASPDQLLRTLEKNLRQAAENAVASAVSSQLNPAINQAITAIDKLSQVTARQIEEHGSRCKSMLIHSAQDELRSQLQADLTQSEEQLRKQLGMALNEIQETSQTLQNNATSEGHLVLAESVDFLKLASTELQRQYTDQLRETTDRASAELSAETVRFSDRQFALLAKQSQSAVGESSALMETRAAEARSQIETTAHAMLADFQQKASAEIEQAAITVQQNFMLSLTSFADEARAQLETKQRAWLDEMARLNEQQCEQFRGRLDEILRSSLVTAISSVNEHSTALLKSMTKDPGQRT
jgi:hypothetical protein